MAIVSVPVCFISFGPKCKKKRKVGKMQKVHGLWMRAELSVHEILLKQKSASSSISSSPFLFDSRTASDNQAEKLLSYNRANRAVAVLCNHQRAPPKTFEQSMANLQTKVRSYQKKNGIRRQYPLHIYLFSSFQLFAWHCSLSSRTFEWLLLDMGLPVLPCLQIESRKEQLALAKKELKRAKKEAKGSSDNKLLA